MSETFDFDKVNVEIRKLGGDLFLRVYDKFQTHKTFLDKPLKAISININEVERTLEVVDKY